MAANAYGSLESPPPGVPSGGHVGGGVSSKSGSADNYHSAGSPVAAATFMEGMSVSQTRRQSRMKVGAATAVAAAVALVAGAALLATRDEGAQTVDFSERPQGTFVSLPPPPPPPHRPASRAPPRALWPRSEMA